jgi:hypothetical protein
VVCLQSPWSAPAHADFLASDLAMETVFRLDELPGEAARGGADKLGIAVLGRWPVTQVRRHALARDAAAEADAWALTVTFDHPSGVLACDHGHSGRGGGRRRRASRRWELSQVAGGDNIVALLAQWGGAQLLESGMIWLCCGGTGD